MATSILLATRGELLALAGVYTIAFLSVMCLFAAGNLILRQTRPELKRTYRAPAVVVILAFIATFVGIMGNIRIDEHNLVFFEFYFVPVLILVLLVIYQDRIVKFLWRATAGHPRLYAYIGRYLADVTDGQFAAFVRHVSRLYPILDYINRNETGVNITLVHCENQSDSKAKLAEIKAALPELKKAGVFPHLNITLIHKNMPFGPEAVNAVAKELRIKKNRIFIGSIHHFHDYDYDDLGGARVIF